MNRAYNPLTGEIRYFQDADPVPSSWIALGAAPYASAPISTGLTPAVDQPTYRVTVTAVNWLPWLLLALFIIALVKIAGD